MEGKIIIFTDGASKGNPGPGGWGTIVSSGSEVREMGGMENSTTNNRMELRAAIEGLKGACGVPAGEEITVYSDSSYVINGITKWAAGWQKSGWRTKKKEEVLNRDLWEALVEAADACGQRIEWRYVGGHAGVPGNERVDRIASDFADGKRVDLYVGPAESYGVDLSRAEAGAEAREKKSHARSRSKAPAHSYVSAIDGVVMVHKTWAECFARVKGKNARFKKAVSAEDEKNIIVEFSKR